MVLNLYKSVYNKSKRSSFEQVIVIPKKHCRYINKKVKVECNQCLHHYMITNRSKSTNIIIEGIVFSCVGLITLGGNF